MRTIVITPEDIIPGEAAKIHSMLDCGVWRIHIRHPKATTGQLAEIIENIPADMRQRISIHDHFELAVPMGIGGVHLNSRNNQVPAGFEGLVSRSCHSIVELDMHPELDYLFLSPIYDSISKTGYLSHFSPDELAGARLGSRIFALGGVRPRHFAELQQLGFGGAAMLGAAWKPFSLGDFRLQYITPAADSVDELAHGVELALKGGCRWVQLRMKDADESDIVQAAALIGPLCHRYNAVFLLDDHVELVAAVGADGVHVGQNDMPVPDVRRVLGPGYIIGATANTLDDMVVAANAGADYIGLGPYRFTTTKKKLKPTLGVKGYQRLMGGAKAAEVDIPVVAIGGIEPDDIAAIAPSGVAGVAISGSIATADSPAEKTKEFINQLNRYLSCKN